MIVYNVLIILQTSLTTDSLQTDINPMHELIEQSDQLKLGWIASESSNIILFSTSFPSKLSRTWFQIYINHHKI